jgi:DNA-binding IclR family transcriptional regulator
VEKALGILDVFSRGRLDLSLSEITDILKMPKATVFRILCTLEKCGFLRKDEKLGTYRLGLKLVYLGNLVTMDYDLVRIAHPIMVALRDETQETVDYTILDNNQVLYIELLESPRRIKAESSKVGRKLPLHCTACGKVLAAFSKEKLDANWPPNVLPAFTKRTITNPRRLMKVLDHVRETGYAVDLGELDEGIYAVSAPILDSTNHALAALTIVAPAERLNEVRILEVAEKVKNAANEVGSRVAGFV